MPHSGCLDRQIGKGDAPATRKLTHLGMTVIKLRTLAIGKIQLGAIEIALCRLLFCKQKFDGIIVFIK